MTIVIGCPGERQRAFCYMQLQRESVLYVGMHPRVDFGTRYRQAEPQRRWWWLIDSW